MYCLDTKNAKQIKVSNDTFFFLSEDEEPILGIDDAELNNIYTLFPDGFEITDWEYCGDDNSILCTFTPYVEDEFDYDLYHDLTNELRIQVKLLSDKKIIVRWLSITKGELETENLEIQKTERGTDFFRTRLGSVFFLKRFKHKQ